MQGGSRADNECILFHAAVFCKRGLERDEACLGYGCGEGRKERCSGIGKMDGDRKCKRAGKEDEGGCSAAAHSTFSVRVRRRLRTDRNSWTLAGLGLCSSGKRSGKTDGSGSLWAEQQV